MEYVLVEPKEVLEIEAIEGADMIEVARVGGWRCVVKKGQFKMGDTALYFALDCVVPTEDERFAFLPGKEYARDNKVEEVVIPVKENDWNPKLKTLGHRIKTKKLRGVVSQGLLFPMSEFPDWQELDLFRYEPKLKFDGAGRPAGNFPSCVPKTDQERIQNIFQGRAWGYGYVKDCPEGTRTPPQAFGDYEVTLKLDGMSGTFLINPDTDEFMMCSRNLWVKDWEDKSDHQKSQGSVFPQVAQHYGLEEKLRKWLEETRLDYPDYKGHLALQGELMGPGIQGNRENFNRFYYFIYDIYLIGEGRYASPSERVGLITALNLTHGSIAHLDHVPHITSMGDIGYTISPETTIDQLLAVADRASINHPIAEGVVFKKHSKQRFSFKVINNKFLLKEKDE